MNILTILGEKNVLYVLFVKMLCGKKALFSG